MSASGVNIATAYVSLVPSVQGIQGNIAQAFQPAEDEAEQAGGRSGKKLAIAAGAAIAASAAVIGVGLKKAYDLGSVFDDVSDTIRAGTGQSGAALEELSGIAKSVATTIPTSFESASQTVTQLTQRLGLTGDNLQTVSEQFVQAGNVLGQDVDITAATKAFAAFGVTNDQVSTQMDTLFRVAQSTGVSMNDLTSAAAAQAPALQELGFGFQDTVSLIGSLDKAGLNATAVTASLGKGLVKMAKDGEEPEQAFQRITGQISDLVSQGQTAQAIDLAAGIFGTKGATQFVGAIQSGTLSMDQLNAAAAGTGDTILGVGEDTADAAESWQLLKNKAMAALEPIGTAVFNLAGDLTGRLVDAFDIVSGRASYFWSVLSGKNDAVDDGPFLRFTQMAGESIRGDLVPAAKDFWQGLTQGFDANSLGILGTVGATINETFGQIFATLGQAWQEIGPPLMAAFKTIWDAVQPLIPTFLQLFQAFNPVGLLFKALLPVLPQIAGVVGKLAQVLADGVAKALQAVAPLLQKIVDVINRLLPFVTDLVASLLPPFVALIDKLAPLLDAVLDALIPVVDALVDALIPAIDALMPIVERVFTFIADTIGNIVTVIGGVIDFITGIFTGDWERVWTGVKEIFGGIWDQIKNIFSTLWDVIVEFFTNLGPTLWGIVTGLAGQLVEWGGQFLGWIWQGIQDLWNGTIWPWFQALPGMAWDGIAAAADWLADRGREFISWIWQGADGSGGLVGAWATVTQWFVDLPANLWGAIQAGWQQVVQWGSDLISWIWHGTDGQGGIVGAAKGIFQWFLDLPGNIWSAIKGIWSQATEWGGQLIKYVIDGISGADPYVSAELAKTMIHAASSLGINVEGIVGFFSGVDVDKSIDDYLAQLRNQADQANPNYNYAYGGRGGIPGRAMGGLFGPIDGRAGGQITVGTHGTADDVLIRGSKREYMVNEQATSRWLPVLDWINAGGIPGFADGGMLGGVGRLIGGSFIQAILPQIQDALNAATASNVSSNGQWGPGTTDGTLAANTAAARAYIVQHWGITDIGGVYGGSVPGSDHPIGKALDVMIADYLSAAGIAQGTSVADWFIGNPNAFGTKYVIWRGRINEGGSWSPYHHPSDPSGTDPTLEHFDHVHLSFLTGTGQFTGGAAADDTKTGGFLGKLFGGIGSLFGSAAPAPVEGGAFPPLVERWRGLMTDVLTQVGNYLGMNLLGDVDRGLHQMDTESSGREEIWNTTDSNAQRGTPSGGLMQVIQPTFETALRGTPFANLIAAGLLNPRANITASALYGLVTGPYHSLAKAWRGVAYDWGGWLMPGVTPTVNMLNKPEAVLDPASSQAYITHAEAIQAGYAGMTGPQLVINLDNSDPLQVAVGQMIQDAWDGAEFELDTIGARR